MTSPVVITFKVTKITILVEPEVLLRNIASPHDSHLAVSYQQFVMHAVIDTCVVVQIFDIADQHVVSAYLEGIEDAHLDVPMCINGNQDRVFTCQKAVIE